MRTAILVLPALALLVPSGTELQTTYTAGSVHRVQLESESEIATVDISIEVDGEPMKAPERAFAGSSSTKSFEYVDRVVEVEDGRPVVVRRTFETVEGVTVRGERETSLESPLVGRTLRLSLDGAGDVEVEVEEGDSVEDDAVLEGHRLGLMLDALLPSTEVEADASWEVESEDLRQALALDVDAALFVPPDFGGVDDRERMRRRMRGGTGASRVLEQAEWSTTATLLEETEDVDGDECLVVELEARGDGDYELGGFGGSGRERSPHAFVVPALVPVDTEFELELEGKLYFSTRTGRPIRLEVEIELSIETENEGERNGRTMSIRRSQSGGVELTVTVTEEEAS